MRKSKIKYVVCHYVNNYNFYNVNKKSENIFSTNDSEND